MNKIYYIYLPIVFLIGCSSLFQTNKERWLHIYDDQPLVTRVPVPEENQIHYNTRNIVANGYQAHGDPWYILLMGSIIVNHNAVDSAIAILPMLRFRSIGPDKRFSENRDLKVFLNDRIYSYEALDYTVKKSKGNFIEDWTVGVHPKLLEEIAYLDTIRMAVGIGLVELDYNMMQPLRALVDTMRTNRVILGQPNQQLKLTK